MSSGSCVVGIDIGTTKIVTLIGTKNEFGVIDIMGLGVYPSYGLRKGIVVDIDKTVASIRASVSLAEEQADFVVESAFVGIAGGHITSRNSKASRMIMSEGRIVKEADKEMVLEAAQAVDVPDDQEILHVISRGFSIDGEGGVANPVGMACRRLEADVHIVSGSLASIQNVTACVQKAGILVEDIVLEPIASSKAVLTEAEKEVNVLLVDIGGGTTDMALFINGAIAHTFVLPIGGNHITQDIAIGLKVPLETAEQVKREHGAASIAYVDEADVFEFNAPMRPVKPFLRRQLAMIIEPRAKEMFRAIHSELIRTSVAQMLAGGIVITGGGAKLSSLGELVTDMFELPVRIGYPLGIGQNANMIDNPMYATAAGLLIYAFDERLEPARLSGKGVGLFGDIPGFGKIVDTVKSWFAEYF